MNLDAQRKYGRTDIAVSVLGFGGNALGNLYDVVEEEAALDTAPAMNLSGTTLRRSTPWATASSLRRYRATALTQMIM